MIKFEFEFIRLHAANSLFLEYMATAYRTPEGLLEFHKEKVDEYTKRNELPIGRH